MHCLLNFIRKENDKISSMICEFWLQSCWNRFTIFLFHLLNGFASYIRSASQGSMCVCLPKLYDACGNCLISQRNVSSHFPFNENAFIINGQKLFHIRQWEIGPDRIEPIETIAVTMAMWWTEKERTKYILIWSVRQINTLIHSKCSPYFIRW